MLLAGRLNQDELSARLSQLLPDAHLVHLHNQIIAAILANTMRDPPEAGIAKFVSANEKPVIGPKPSIGDQAEKRVKHEVMQLTRRERARIKMADHVRHPSSLATAVEIANCAFQTPNDSFAQALCDHHASRRARAAGPGSASAGGYQKTSTFAPSPRAACTECPDWDLELRKRYAQPLFSETQELPDIDTVAARMVPICYENGLPSGCASECPIFMNLATEMYIKEVLQNIVARVRSNGQGLVKTAAYKRIADKEEDLVLRGELSLGAGGLLPIEAKEAQARKPLDMEDLQLCLRLGDPYLGRSQLLAAHIMNTVSGGDEWRPEQSEDKGKSNAAPVASKAKVNDLPNGNAAGWRNGDGITGRDTDMPDADTQEMSWAGAGLEDGFALDSVLDACLGHGT